MSCVYDIRVVNSCVVVVDVVNTVVDAVGGVVGCGCRVFVYHSVFDGGVSVVPVDNGVVSVVFFCRMC